MWMPVKYISELPSHLEEFIWESLLSLALKQFSSDSSSKDLRPTPPSSPCQLEDWEGQNGNSLKSGTTGDEHGWSTQALENLIP